MKETNYWAGFDPRKASRRRLLKGTVAVSAGMIGAVPLGCSSSPSRATGGSAKPSSAGTPQSGGTAHLALDYNMASIDPQAYAGVEWNTANAAALSTLLGFKQGADPKIWNNHQLENVLAVKVESSDAQTRTIQLRPDATFHDVPPVNGHPVEAEDVKATFIRALTAPRSVLRAPLDMVDPNQIETPAKDTVVFKFKYPYAPFPAKLTSTGYCEILPREALAGDYDPTKQVIGSGPFTWENYAPDVSVNLKKNPNYFEKGRPYVDEVQMPVIPDSAQQVAQFTAGHLDALKVQETDIDTAKRGNPKAQVLADVGLASSLLYFQLGDPKSPFQDIRVRRAISMAIDRDAIGRAVFNHYVPVFYLASYMGKWAFSMTDLDPSVQQYYKFDLAAAKQLLTEAGGASLNVRLAYFTGGGGSGPAFTKVSQAIYNMLKELPWQLSLVALDYTKDVVGGGKGYRYGNIPNDVIFNNLSSPLTTADDFLFNYYSSKSVANTERLKDPTLDAMIDKARTILDEEQQRTAYLDVQKYLASKMYSVAGFPAGYNYELVQPWVQNFYYQPLGEGPAPMLSNLWLKR